MGLPRLGIFAGAIATLWASQAAPAVAASAVALAVAPVARKKDSACSDLPDVAEGACLAKDDGKCMWLSLGSKNLCLPCVIGGVNIPCVPPGATYAMDSVKTCSMACQHQQVLSKVSSCTDVSGDIAQSDCEAKGTSGDVKCMWTAYRTKSGRRKSMCGPCLVEGMGVVPPYAEGGEGPELGSRVEASSSQCAEVLGENGLPCGVMPCSKKPPTAPGGLPAPVHLEDLGFSAVRGAPTYIAVPVEAPYDAEAYARAAAAGAHVAGWPEGTELPPKAAVAAYGPPPPGAPSVPSGIEVVYAAPPPGLMGLPPVFVPPPNASLAEAPVAGAVPPGAGVAAGAATPGAALLERPGVVRPHRLRWGRRGDADGVPK